MTDSGYSFQNLKFSTKDLKTTIGEIVIVPLVEVVGSLTPVLIPT